MNKRILIIGKNGQLGMTFHKLVRDPSILSNIKTPFFDFGIETLKNNWDFFFTSRGELDLSNQESINEFFLDQQFTAIINCAAYTSVDKAETDEELAEQINHFAVAKLAEIAKKQSIPLIHISTDYVFNGGSLKPYAEADIANPQNVYGLTKLKGERAIIASGCAGAIIRTSWLYSEFGKNFVKTMLDLSKVNNSISVVKDQVGSPTYATNLAKLILIMLNIKQTNEILNSQFNTYHFSDEGICSWCDFAKVIFQLSNINCEVYPIETKEYPSIAKRPLYNVMNKDKIKYHLKKLTIPHWRDSLISCINEIKKQKDLLV